MYEWRGDCYGIDVMMLMKYNICTSNEAWILHHDDDDDDVGSKIRLMCTHFFVYLCLCAHTYSKQHSIFTKLMEGLLSVPSMFSS